MNAHSTPVRRTPIFPTWLIALLGLCFAAMIVLEPWHGTTDTSAEKNAIYPLHHPSVIEIFQPGQTNTEALLRIVRNEEEWLIEHPFTAPARTVMVDALLATNRYSARQYSARQLQDAGDLFESAPILKIDDFAFALGNVEPVSSLRYILAGDTVYLQPDQIVPMLSAGVEAFVDMRPPTAGTKIESPVTSSAAEQDQLAAWSGLRAQAVLGHTNQDTPIRNLPIAKENGDIIALAVYRAGDSVSLHWPNKPYRYRLSAQDASALKLLPDLP